MVYLHVDSRVCKVSELLVTKTQTHTNTKELRELDDEALDLLLMKLLKC